MSDRPVVLALHYQNDVLHPQGRIRVGLAEDAPERTAVIAAAGHMLTGAHERGWQVRAVLPLAEPDADAEGGR